MPTLGPYPPLGLCRIFAAYRIGTNAEYAAALQRIGTAPDGSGVVFEVTFEFSLLKRLGFESSLTPDQEGIFYVRSDGTGLRRLGPASREPGQLLIDLDGGAYAIPFFMFSPNSKLVGFTDRGPGPHGEDAAQVAILDLETGDRRLLTRLSDAPPEPDNPALPVTYPPFFLDDRSLQFGSRAPHQLNPEATYRLFTMNIDGTELRPVPPPIAIPGSDVVPAFSITRPIASGNLTSLDMPGTPVNAVPEQPTWGILEVFVVGPDHVLQLTNFRRNDTGTFNPATDGTRVFFTASADPLGLNPFNNCQFFSVDMLGGDLRQLTQLGTGEPSTIGCLPLAQPPETGCYSYSGPVVDADAGTIVFTSTCDPLGTNPNGEQFFAMRLDGSGLRQLTSTRGITTGADGSIDVELPGPGADSAPGGSLY
jgi:hypothetical protein